MRLALSPLLSFLLLASFATAQSWNEFRGPAGTGVAAEAKPPLKPDPTAPAWKSTRQPQGQSSMVIHNGRLFTTTVGSPDSPDGLSTIALDTKNGKLLWQKAAPTEELERVHKSSSPAASTPLVDAERLYVYFGSFGLLCYDHDGKEVWRKPIPTPKSLYGTAGSPIDAGTNLILVVDNDNNAPESRGSASKILCVNKATGATVWEQARPFHRSGWSTPTLWHHEQDGKATTELVVLGNGSVVGYDAASGTYKWHVTGFPRETIARPVVAGNHIVLSCAHGAVSEDTLDPAPFWAAMKRFDTDASGAIEKDEIGRHFTLPFRPELPLDHPGFGMPLPDDPGKRSKRQNGLFDHMDQDKDGAITEAELAAGIRGRKGKPRLMAIRPGGEGDITASHVAWEHTKGIPEIPSPLYHDNRLYLVRNGGLLSCVNAETGEQIYRERLGASGQYRASPVLANGHLYLVSERGSVSVVKAGDAFEKVHSFELGDPCLTTPVIAGDTIYFRTKFEVVAFREVRSQVK